MTQVAIIADAHFHDVYGDYDFAGPVNSRTGKRACVRTLAVTVRSTRIFNESYYALRSALNDIVRRGIGHVILAGDYSDDGQRTTVDGVLRLFEDYASRHGIRFYAT